MGRQPTHALRILLKTPSTRFGRCSVFSRRSYSSLSDPTLACIERRFWKGLISGLVCGITRLSIGKVSAVFVASRLFFLGKRLNSIEVLSMMQTYLYSSNVVIAFFSFSSTDMATSDDLFFIIYAYSACASKQRAAITRCVLCMSSGIKRHFMRLVERGRE